MNISFRYFTIQVRYSIWKRRFERRPPVLLAALLLIFTNDGKSVTFEFFCVIKHHRKREMSYIYKIRTFKKVNHRRCVSEGIDDETAAKKHSLGWLLQDT